MALIGVKTNVVCKEVEVSIEIEVGPYAVTPSNKVMFALYSRAEAPILIATGLDNCTLAEPVELAKPIPRREY